MHQLDTGSEESWVYEQLGRRLELPEYYQLLQHISQYIRMGTKDLRNLMEQEMQQALENAGSLQRKRRGGINKAVISHDPAVGSCYGNDRISGLGRIVEDRRDVKRMGAWKRFMQEEDGMGVVEVILIIVVLVAMVLIFKEQISALVETIWTTINRDAKKVYS